MNIINNRLNKLRAIMQKQGVAAYIVPGTDPHAGEYFADYWKERDWISGFDGSAGTAVITLDKAGVWVDSRYYIQADVQLKNTGYVAMKMGLPETPDMLTWIASELKSGDQVGVNPLLFSVNAFMTMRNQFLLSGIELVQADLIKPIWEERPALPEQKIFVYDVVYAGQSCMEKMAILRQKIKEAHADVFVLNTLDDIAWLFNIRGNDVSYNPVATAYALIDESEAVIYISDEKLTEEVRLYLASQQLLIKDYQQIYNDLGAIPKNKKVLLDGSKINQSLFEAIAPECGVINRMSPVTMLKSIKNETEILGMRQAMIKDGVALTRFFIWLEASVCSGELTEVSIAEKLYEFRAEQENFFGESFGTIAGYAAHGAIVHYKADEKSKARVLQEGILLIDSGGQFLEGTTDITRTITLGNPTPQQKTDFTLVLKGHIGIATAVFPVGTRGSQLDILARKAMWDRRLNYGHGTGHGVGHFLNVHEGPQNIRMDENPVTLQPGMFISNEPGLYRKDAYGIRTENLIMVTPDQQSEFGQFLKFETLTFFPIDITLIDTKLLTNAEIGWLNAYHQEVYDKIAPHLNEMEREWLRNKTKAVEK
ncbi:MAG: aminopeptidase P family protein [Paludibacter sp.]|nr:aminopeptidase P family protein [Paludibacter sp.]